MKKRYHKEKAYNDGTIAYNDKPTAYNDGTTAYNDIPTTYNDGTTAYIDKPTTHNKYYHIRQLWRSILTDSNCFASVYISTKGTYYRLKVLIICITVLPLGRAQISAT